jgi:ketosteroid isomerase-like protein
MTHTAGPPTDKYEINRLHADWVFGWERNDGDGPFRFADTFAQFYDWDSTDVLLYDDFDPQHRVASNAVGYGAIWEPIFNTVRNANHVIAEGPHAVLSTDLAASSLVFLARIEPLAGAISLIRTTTALVWRRTAHGWRIIREHNSTVRLSEGEYAAALESSIGNSARDHAPVIN